MFRIYFCLFLFLFSCQTEALKSYETEVLKKNDNVFESVSLDDSSLVSSNIKTHEELFAINKNRQEEIQSKVENKNIIKYCKCSRIYNFTRKYIDLLERGANAWQIYAVDVGQKQELINPHLLLLDKVYFMNSELAQGKARVFVYGNSRLQYYLKGTFRFKFESSINRKRNDSLDLLDDRSTKCKVVLDSSEDKIFDESGSSFFDNQLVYNVNMAFYDGGYAYVKLETKKRNDPLAPKFIYLRNVIEKGDYSGQRSKIILENVQTSNKLKRGCLDLSIGLCCAPLVCLSCITSCGCCCFCCCCCCCGELFD